MFNFEQQIAYEAEGAAAGLAGKTREDCPYHKDLNKDHWNHWVYGCENALGEIATIKKGFVEFCTEQSPDVILRLPVDEAIRSGQWKPKYAIPWSAYV
jgi:ribosome modulation factor